MFTKRAAVVAVVGALGLALVIVATLFHALPGDTPPVARGESHAHARHLSHPSRLSQPAPSHASRTVRPALAPVLAPLAPADLAQVGGREPALRPLAVGSWLNTRGVTITIRMASAMAATRLQAQVEMRAMGHPFSGQVTATGPVVAYTGHAVQGVVHVWGLREGMAYRWRVRVHDLHGLNSPWVDSAPLALRVFLGHPLAPAPRLVTPSRNADWVASRLVTLRWPAPPDASGIRGYSFTLSRDPGAVPPTRWRTARHGVTVRAAGEGTWYFAVRALDWAHTWGPTSRLTIHIDSRKPELRTVRTPLGIINPARVRPLLRMTLTDLSRVTAQIVTPRGHIVASIPLSYHPSGYQLTINWDGRDAGGRLVPNGAYMLRLSAVNHAGTTWRTTRPLTLETMPPGIVAQGQTQTGTYNPYNNGLDGPEVITASLNEPAHVRIEAVHGGLVRRVWTFDEPRAGAVMTATWNGKSASGVLIPGGLYIFRLVATDAAGNRATYKLGWVVVDHRRIVVSLDQQQLWALDGNRVLLTSLVTTGGPELPTPTGDYQILDRESPFTFHSPFPKSSPFWYPPSPTNFALLFDYQGYFIHDAPWRGFYGPGSNSVDGIPGSNTTGTHGCVNVPYYQMQWLFSWASMYTPVQIRQSFTPPPQ